MSFGLDAVTVSFGATRALRDVSVEVAAGTVVAVVGGDGAGKTTLLRTLVREVAPDSGTVSAPPKADLGFLPASSGSWAALTVAQNVDFAGGVYGLAGPELDARRAALLDAAGLTDAADRLASQLSGGMRRKLGFLMAIVHTPELVVLDEPSTGVDPVSRVDLWRLVSETAAAGAAVIMSTTYLDEAERAGHLVVLDDGHVLVQGSYDEVRAAFAGVVTRADAAVRPAWSWRRGRDRHEYWPDGDAPAGRDVVEPDLEDIVIALSLSRRADTVVAG
ncbi:ATP-binding cassette domain-containing protein [Cellulomonas alba]|uniref:ABC transporter ATP-binding protein n=1 Tax=Cellulomonas alba TaxID=3053467 RepID=A0ABT7SCJ0_9CELL|nr:ABC transporter ATP-binding protein [Cellulomonas alba]MDM7853900.1 ABC transporter ATP-binding protein [Cellulomonas alba]